ncbi:MAG: hypothetical protein PHV82_04590, partial [Victivallaceae bacterium]|nr:hypothetical protein [Victivallaceae bacterium]
MEKIIEKVNRPEKTSKFFRRMNILKTIVYGITACMLMPSLAAGSAITICPMDKSGHPMSLANGIVNIIYLYGPKGQDFQMELPEAIKVIGILGGRTYVALHTPSLKYESTQIKKNDENYIRYTVKKNPYGELTIGLMPVQVKEKEKTICFCSGDDDKNKRTVTAKIYPELPDAPTPENFKLWLWRGQPISGCFGNEEFFDRLTETYHKMGISAVVETLRNKNFITALHKKGFKYLAFHRLDTENAMNPYYKWRKDKLPKDISTIDFTGNYKGCYCPTYFNQNSELILDKLLKRDKEAILMGADGILFDLELTTPMNCCFCERCLRDFADNLHLPSSKISRSSAFSDYKKEWILFRTKQIAKSMEIICRNIKKINPEAIFYIVSHSLQDKLNNSRQEIRWLEKTGGVDIRLLDQFADAHGPMWYTNSRSIYNLFELNRPALKKPLIPAVDIGQHMGARS